MATEQPIILVDESAVIPFVPNVADQEFLCTIENVVYTFRARWNALSGTWYLDVLTETNEPIFMGARLVLGAFLGRTCTHPLFTRGVFIAVDLSNEHREAQLEDLGTRVEIRRYTIRQFWRRAAYREIFG